MIKTRFAPSPTGDLHIGGLRTALYNYLFAKKNNGQFILRIEDTDQARYQEGSVEIILESLTWAGLKFDGSPTYQSRRVDIYSKYAEKLINDGSAYYCFCSSSTLDKMRQKQMSRGVAAKYDRRCLKLSEAEIKAKLDQGEPHVIRMKVPAGKTKFKDLIRGEVEINNSELDDQVLIKSDGYPTYHLANVVDDNEMGITHVIRAEEWLPSTPKHIILYSMLGWDLPEFAHIPLVLAPDKSKLSKRHGAVSVLEFKKLGYLPEALINYLALLGWNPGTDREIFSLSELEKEFSLDKVHSAGAIFDTTKLDWMNSTYIKLLDVQTLAGLCIPYLQDAKLINEQLTANNQQYIKKVITLEQERIKKLSEIPELTEYFFKQPKYETKLLKWKKGDLKTAKQRLEFLADQLKQIPNSNWTRNSLEDLISDLIKNHDLGTGDTLWPMRAALTGREKSPSPFEIAEVLGKEKTLQRLKIAIEKL